MSKARRESGHWADKFHQCSKIFSMLTLHPYDEQEDYASDPWAPLPEQLQVYLTKIDGFPHLAQLAECEPYTNTRLSLETTYGMAGELEQFTSLVTARSLPTPPAHIGFSPGEAADEPFGWDGLSGFCESLASVLEQCMSKGLGIVSVGD